MAEPNYIEPILGDKAPRWWKGYRKDLKNPMIKDYHGVTAFYPAGTNNYRTPETARTISQVVVHITGGTDKPSEIQYSISTFMANKFRKIRKWIPQYKIRSHHVKTGRTKPNPRRPETILVEIEKSIPKNKPSAHYIVNRDGKIVQMVKEFDIAQHAGEANSKSIGIEHVNTWNSSGHDKPTIEQYIASAKLVRDICERHNIPMNHVTSNTQPGIIGHKDADGGTGHSNCPDAAWDWNFYIKLVRQPFLPFIYSSDGLDKMRFEMTYGGGGYFIL